MKVYIFFQHITRTQVLSFVVWYIDIFGGRATPIAVNGHFSTFSLLVMSYETRMLPLQVRCSENRG